MSFEIKEEVRIMYAMAWKEIQPNGNQPIKVKTFSTEEKRQKFIDRLNASGIRFQITSLSAENSRTVSDFRCGMRVRIEKALHTEYIGREGVVDRTVKKDSTVCVRFEDGTRYRSFAWNLEPV